MKYATLITLLFLSNFSFTMAEEVDFSNAYLIKETTSTDTLEETLEDGTVIAKEIKVIQAFLTNGILSKKRIETVQTTLTDGTVFEEVHEEILPPILHIGGIKTTTHEEDTTFIFDWSLSLDFASHANCQFNNENNDVPFRTSTSAQEAIDPLLLQQTFEGTVWTGDYKTAKNRYLTEMKFVNIQNGLVSAEITHTTREIDSEVEVCSSEYEAEGFLCVKAMGDITTEYQINQGTEEEEELVWLTVSEYHTKIEQINHENNDKSEDDIVSIPTIRNIRQLFTLKRMRAIGNNRHVSSRWGSHNEYHLTWEDGVITGVSGTPAESYSNSNQLTGIGQIELFLKSDVVDSETKQPFE